MLPEHPRAGNLLAYLQRKKLPGIRHARMILYNVISGHLQSKTSRPLYPKSGRVQCNSVCPLCAKSGLQSLFIVDH